MSDRNYKAVCASTPRARQQGYATQLFLHFAPLAFSCQQHSHFAPSNRGYHYILIDATQSVSFFVAA